MENDSYYRKEETSEGRSSSSSQHYHNDGLEPYTLMEQSGIPVNIPYGLLRYLQGQENPERYQQNQENPRNLKVKDTLRKGKWTVSYIFMNVIKKLIVIFSTDA
jgi:hypothetical protein